MLLCSCNKHIEQQKSDEKFEPLTEPKTKAKTVSEIDLDYSISAELFAKEVLKKDLRKHTFNISNFDRPKHTQIFDNIGLEKIEAYSNKNYPSKTEPKYYEHFTLFVATYHSEINALKTFALINMSSKKTLSDYQKAQKAFIKRVNALNIGTKPGGMIVQSGRQIFSLVKTCRDSPIGTNWNDYEKKLIKYLTRRGDEEFKVLSSNCGMDKYELKSIKSSR